jgi:transposase InsO family protein
MQWQDCIKPGRRDPAPRGLAGRGRQPQAAARRAGLEFVEKLLTGSMVALLAARNGDAVCGTRLGCRSAGAGGESGSERNWPSWSRMQVELLNRRRWRTRVELANAIFDYLEIFHNRQRRHSALGMLTPIQFEHASTVA